jgi:hypothetical protein
VPRIILSLLATVAAAFAFAGGASAAGGNYVFDGGTPAQQSQVRAALNASSFDWSIVPSQVTIHIARGSDSDATRGEIHIDADLLASGKFAWGTIQHEYAHQVDFFLLSDDQRVSAAPALGGKAWYPSAAAVVAHSQLTAERFASTLAWSYWSSSDNTLKPQSAKDESAAMAPAQFRALLVSLLGPAAAPTTVARSLLAAKRV